jgi:hypothetical protein
MNEEQQMIQDFLEGSGLEEYADTLIKVRHKMWVDVPVTLQTVLEDFYEYLKLHSNEI